MIERNVFIECDEGISFGLTKNIDSGNYAMENAIVRNNFMYNCFSDEIEFSNSKNIEIYNNTIVKRVRQDYQAAEYLAGESETAMAIHWT